MNIYTVSVRNYCCMAIPSATGPSLLYKNTHSSDIKSQPLLAGETAEETHFMKRGFQRRRFLRKALRQASRNKKDNNYRKHDSPLG